MAETSMAAKRVLRSLLDYKEAEMLVLTRKDKESITIMTDPPVVVTLNYSEMGRASIGIDVDKRIKVLRSELVEDVDKSS